MQTEKQWIVYADDVLSNMNDIQFCYYVSGPFHRWVEDVKKAETFTKKDAEHILTLFPDHTCLKIDLHPRFRYA